MRIRLRASTRQLAKSYTIELKETDLLADLKAEILRTVKIVNDQDLHLSLNANGIPLLEPDTETVTVLGIGHGGSVYLLGWIDIQGNEVVYTPPEGAHADVAPPAVPEELAPVAAPAVTEAIRPVATSPIVAPPPVVAPDLTANSHPAPNSYVDDPFMYEGMYEDDIRAPDPTQRMTLLEPEPALDPLLELPVRPELDPELLAMAREVGLSEWEFIQQTQALSDHNMAFRLARQEEEENLNENYDQVFIDGRLISAHEFLAQQRGSDTNDAQPRNVAADTSADFQVNDLSRLRPVPVRDMAARHDRPTRPPPSVVARQLPPEAVRSQRYAHNADRGGGTRNRQREPDFIADVTDLTRPINDQDQFIIRRTPAALRSTGSDPYITPPVRAQPREVPIVPRIIPITPDPQTPFRLPSPIQRRPSVPTPTVLHDVAAAAYEDDEDEELARALALSTMSNPSSTDAHAASGAAQIPVRPIVRPTSPVVAPVPIHHDVDLGELQLDEDRDLLYAITRSIEEAQQNASEAPVADNRANEPWQNDFDDDDLQLAMQLSMQAMPSTATAAATPSPNQHSQRHRTHARDAAPVNTTRTQVHSRSTASTTSSRHPPTHEASRNSSTNRHHASQVGSASERSRGTSDARSTQVPSPEVYTRRPNQGRQSGSRVIPGTTISPSSPPYREAVTDLHTRPIGIMPRGVARQSYTRRAAAGADDAAGSTTRGARTGEEISNVHDRHRNRLERGLDQFDSEVQDLSGRNPTSRRHQGNSGRNSEFY